MKLDQPPNNLGLSYDACRENPNSIEGVCVPDTKQGKRKDAANRVIGNGNTRLKKLRLLLQAGAPLGAVEQRAKIEGIDIALVLSPSADANEERLGEEDAVVFIPETLIKKYKRMIKAGVPVDRVEQLAAIETGATPELVASVIKGTGHEKAHVVEEDMLVNPLLSKFRRMKKA